MMKKQGVGFLHWHQASKPTSDICQCQWREICPGYCRNDGDCSLCTKTTSAPVREQSPGSRSRRFLFWTSWLTKTWKVSLKKTHPLFGSHLTSTVLEFLWEFVGRLLGRLMPRVRLSSLWDSFLSSGHSFHPRRALRWAHDHLAD